jgi:hypothetical protein
VTTDYETYLDDVIVAVADRQVGPNLLPINLDDLHAELFADRPPTWLQTAVKELSLRGYGKDWGTMNARVFMIDGPGISRAHTVRAMRRPKSVIEQLTGDTSQKLVNVGNFAVASLALVVAAFALWKSS